ncbi:hypothetical protein MBAV_004751 [Candidatus Magnetobacterium bavaricum]|uniref:Uncharacterized protein n=1 Tax=Candidatus Magnetobacterium bavaricum TaxID=29290 RepID=A0A0F3GMD1_9BACT|nr:hypothetical protein MBAV_004751 [Candidatus Magnetobacterium bavaricum]
MARLYKDYIAVDKDFIPVFSHQLDKKYPDRWKEFVPHGTFNDILSDLAGALEMSSIQAKKSLWVSGAYGTGKTYASFAIKHILEDSIEEVTDYLKELKTTLTRFTKLKQKGDILVVHRSSSSGIIGDNKLFGVIQESIKQALKEKGYTYLGAKSLYSNMLDILKTPDHPFNFTAAFWYCKAHFTEYASPEEVVSDIERLDGDSSLELMMRVVEIADNLGFHGFLRSHKDIIDWIEDVIKGNNLRCIVFIWDEFTEYFRNNQDRLTGLQELAQMSATTPFYFLLITHLTHAQVISAPQSKKRMEARFKLRTIEMPDTTAFMLMGKAIQTVPELKNEWDIISEDLWSRVEGMVTATIMQYAGNIKKEELKALLPLHPYAAYMLKIISAVISSNQRTMFQFLSGDSGQDRQGRHNFRWYIENHSVAEWCYLTSDYIWDYFFYLDNPDLDKDTRSAIIHYNSFENQCGDEGEKRVLKVVLLLVAMQRVGGGATRGVASLLRPTLSNISAAFEGSDIHDNVRITMDRLVEKRILGSIPEGHNDILYVTQPPIPTQTPVDFPFEKIITDYDVHRHFTLSGYAKARFTITCATHLDIKKKLSNSHLANKIYLVFMFAKNEEDSLKSDEIIIKQLQEYNGNIVVADMSSQPLGEQKFNNFIEFMTHENYFSIVDHNQQRYYENQARRVIDEWMQRLDVTTVCLYTKNEPLIRLQGNTSFRAKIKDINAKLYPDGLETLTIMDSLFAETGFSDKVSLMGMGKLNIATNLNYLTVIKNKLIEANLWHTHNYAESNPAHPVSKMKTVIERLIDAGFEKNNYVMIADIWSAMQAKPFGLMKCVGSAFLMGFLLKEYADNNYYRDDGSSTVALSHDVLAYMIVGIIKDSPKAKTLRIVRMPSGQERLNLLLEKWRDLTGTDTPGKWASNMRIPVLCLFEGELKEAADTFSIINKPDNPMRNEQIDSAIRFLENSQNVKTLSDIARCNEIFKEFITGEYGILFTGADINNLKDILHKRETNVYNWYYSKARFDPTIKELASQKYGESYCGEIFQAIDSLPPEKVKDYLKELVKSDPLVGISIMKRTKGKATP